MTFSNDFPFHHFLLVQTYRVDSDPDNNTFIFSSSNFVTFSHDLSLVDFLLVETCRINSDPSNTTFIFSASNRPTFPIVFHWFVFSLSKLWGSTQSLATFDLSAPICAKYSG